jgi:hypothetical protein
VLRRHITPWLAWVLIVSGALLILYPGLHKSANGSTTSCGPAFFVIFPSDPGSSTEAEQASMDACLRQGAVLLVVGVGLIGGGVWLRTRNRRHTVRVPRRPDVQ